MANIFQETITPDKPKVLDGERVYVYVPRATLDTPGIASYDKDDFVLNNGKVHLLKDIDEEIAKHNIDPDAHKNLFESKVDKVTEHPGGGILPATKGEILSNGMLVIKSSTTNLEENISKELTVSPYGISIVTNNIDSDEIATKSQVDKKVNIETIRDVGYNLMPGGRFNGTVTNTFNTEGIMSIESKAEGTNNDTIRLVFDATRSKLTYSKTNDISYNGEVATQPYVDNKSVADRLYVDTKITEVKKAVPYAFDTLMNFIDWLAGSYIREDDAVPSDLNIGDDILIVEEGVPDYWVKSISTPMTIADFAPYESGDYKPTILWLED